MLLLLIVHRHRGLCRARTQIDGRTLAHHGFQRQQGKALSVNLGLDTAFCQIGLALQVDRAALGERNLRLEGSRRLAGQRLDICCELGIDGPGRTHGFVQVLDIEAVDLRVVQRVLPGSGIWHRRNLGALPGWLRICGCQHLRQLHAALRIPHDAALAILKFQGGSAYPLLLQIKIAFLNGDSAQRQQLGRRRVQRRQPDGLELRAQIIDNDLQRPPADFDAQFQLRVHAGDVERDRGRPAAVQETCADLLQGKRVDIHTPRCAVNVCRGFGCRRGCNLRRRRLPVHTAITRNGCSDVAPRELDTAQPNSALRQVKRAAGQFKLLQRQQARATGLPGQQHVGQRQGQAVYLHSRRALRWQRELYLARR